MLESTNFSVPNDYDDVWIVGIRIDPDNEGSDFFTILFTGDVDVPLLSDDYVIFFQNTDSLSRSIKMMSPKVYKSIDLLEICTIDIAQTLYLINYELIDDSAVIVDSLNIIIDIIEAIKLPMPNRYRDLLFKVADFFTFNKKVTELFTDDDIDKDDVVNIILWCIGAVCSKSKFMTEQT